MNEQPYAVLGIHGEDVPTVDAVTEVTDENGNTVQVVEQRNVVRVRMFVDGKMVDEDFNLPRIITIEEQVETAVKARIAEIQKNGPDPSTSQVVDAQPEQIVEDIK